MNMLESFNEFIKGSEYIGENVSIDLDMDSENLKFASIGSKNKLNIKKNEQYIKNGRPLNSVLTVTAYGKPYNYQVYVTGKPFNIKSIEPISGNNVKITYYTGGTAKTGKKEYLTKSTIKSLDIVKDYLPALIKGEDINPMLIPFKLIRV
jgi:hypothetical protein